MEDRKKSWIGAHVSESVVRSLKRNKYAKESRLFFLKSLLLSDLSAGSRKLKFFGMIFVLGVLVLSGCATTNHQDLSVTLSDSLKNETVQVDIAGIKKDQVSDYNNVTPNEYWALDSKYRNNLSKRTIVFSPNEYATATISRNSPVWDMWNLNKEDFLLIAVDLPPDVGNSINWKLIIPMPYFSVVNFWSTRKDNFVVDSTGLTYVE